MEQTTTWACPVCDKILNTEELIIDMYVVFGLLLKVCTYALRRYFDDILKCTPDAVEDVIVEADGEWHTEDDKYGSQGWMASAASRPRPPERKVKAEPDTKPPREPSADQARPKPAEYLVLDSDDDDDSTPATGVPADETPKSVGPPSASSSRPQSQTQAVIDLTLSSDDEADELPLPPPPPPALLAQAPVQEAANGAFKRKERDSTSQDSSWKRSRVEHPANGFMPAQNDDNRPPMREEPRLMRSNSRPPNQYAHPSYPHPSTAASGRAPDYPGPAYGYGQHHNAHHGLPPANAYPHRYNPNGYNNGNRYPAYGAAPYHAEPPLPFTANGRAPPTLPRPHTNPGPGTQNGNNNTRGDVWY
jgi:E3 SUMO-protein ligase PIAS1